MRIKNLNHRTYSIVNEYFEVGFEFFFIRMVDFCSYLISRYGMRCTRFPSVFVKGWISEANNRDVKAGINEWIIECNIKRKTLLNYGKKCKRNHCKKHEKTFQWENGQFCLSAADGNNRLWHFQSFAFSVLHNTAWIIQTFHTSIPAVLLLWWFTVNMRDLMNVDSTL